jgi:predicted nucleotidyltransferase
MTTPTLSKENTFSIIGEFKRRIEKLYKGDLTRIVLYGSWARNESTLHSDIDLAVFLQGDILPGREIDRMIDIIDEFNLKYDVLLSILPISESIFLKLNSPLYRNIKKEGIQI